MPHDNVAVDEKHTALARRYGAGSIPAVGPWNETIARLLEHRSIRGYRTDDVPPGTFETLVAAAQSAATSSNMQSWSVIAVRDGARKARLAKLAQAQKHIEQCPMFLVFLADLSRNARLAEAEGITLEALPYFETFLVAAIDAALAAQNAVIAAESLGLSTVYIGAMRNSPVEVARELGLPPGCHAVFGLCIGYAAPDTPSEIKPRLPQAAIAFEEQYVVPDEVALRTRYDLEMGAFSKRNEIVHDTWTARVKSRLGVIASMNGRHKLADALKALGFPLR